MAASKNLLPSPQHNHLQHWRSRRFSSPASVIVFSCLLLTLSLLVFFFLPPTTTAFTSSSAAINVKILSFSSIFSLSSTSDIERNDTVSPPPPTTYTTGFSRTSALTELKSCDLFNGSWVVDRAGPLYPPGSCPNVDDAFNCFNNGRPDRYYLYYRWKPNGCEIPRFDGRKLLSMLRNKRAVFVGDSLNRNMWQSLICSLRHSLPNNSSIQATSHSKVLYSFRFNDYNCTVDYIKSPFLVQRWRIKGFQGNRRETLRLDIMQDTLSDLSADIIVFNTGHWWTHQKTRHGINYFQEGDYIHNKLRVAEAFKRALKTWARWVDKLVNNDRSLLFFSGYSASHFRGGQWNSGGGCDGETQPIEKETELSPYPWMMKELESVMSKMKKQVTYLNITRMTGYRRDAHPSIFRHPPGSGGAAGGAVAVQDCSHWCLPGVPDSWNQLFYAYLLMMLSQS